MRHLTEHHRGHRGVSNLKVKQRHAKLYYHVKVHMLSHQIVVTKTWSNRHDLVTLSTKPHQLTISEDDRERDI